MGIAVGDNFELLFKDDDGYIVDDTLVRGGYSIVATEADRNKIPVSARKEGMIVYVQTTKLEYRLENGVDDTNWAVHNSMVDDGKTYARTDSPNFTGLATYTQVDTVSSGTITKVDEIYQHDYDTTFLQISLTPEEKAKYQMYTLIKGSSSGAQAAIISHVDTGILIPSTNAPISKSSYRNGTFIQNERIIFVAGSVIAQKDEQLVTLNGLFAKSVNKMGGRVYGALELRPIYRYVTEASVTSVQTEGSLNISYVKMNFTAEDLKHVHNAMTVDIINPTTGAAGDTVKTIRLMTSGTGFIINTSDAAKFVVGRKVKVMSAVLMPSQPNHMVCKEYVDGIVRPVNLELKASSFVKSINAEDVLKKTTRTVWRHTISKELFSKDHLPLFKIYADYTVGTYSYKYAITDPDVRVALRATSTSEYELVVEFWDIEPYDCEIHVI